jgi:HSP20 family protein
MRIRWDSGRSPHHAFAPPVGRGETRNALNLRIILPGVRRQDLRMRVDGGVLRLAGERYPPPGFAEGGRCQFAMPYGAFAQNLPLPDGLDVDRMRSRLHEGVLDVHIPFAAVVPEAVSIVATPVLPALEADVPLPVAV